MKRILGKKNGIPLGSLIENEKIIGKYPVSYTVREVGIEIT